MAETIEKPTEKNFKNFYFFLKVSRFLACEQKQTKVYKKANVRVLGRTFSQKNA